MLSTNTAEDAVKKINIYYDKFNDLLTFTRRKGLAKAVAKVNIPDDTVRDGDCLILPDVPAACFQRRRVTATELLLRAVVNWDNVSVAEYDMGVHTFTYYGKHKPGVCLHGFKFPCERCEDARRSDEEYGIKKTDEEFRERFTRQVQRPVTA